VLGDFFLSAYRMRTLGLDCELNPIVRKSCQKRGIYTGLAGTTLFPWACALAVAAAFKADILLAILLGMRLMFGLEQFSTLKIPSTK
jgi:hypothetical protein